MSKKQLAADTSTKEIAVFDMEAHAGAGFEGATADAYAVPYLTILQALSKRVKKSNAEYIKGAETGMICDTSINRVYSGTTGVTLVPVAFRHVIAEWVPRNAVGGGMAPDANGAPRKQKRGKVGEYEPSKLESLTVGHNDKGKPLSRDGNELIDTRIHYCLLVDGQSVKPVVFAMSSSHIKTSKLWMSMMSERKALRRDGKSMYQLPSFSGMYMLTTKERIDGQDSWFVPEITFIGPVDDNAIIQAALAFKEIIDAGKVTVTGDDDADDSAPATQTEKF